MKIAIASDHRGYHKKQKLITWLEKEGHTAIDLGTDSNESVDTVDFAQSVAKHIKKNPRDKGILICGNGMGMSITANRFSHIRAGLIYSTDVAKGAREHNNINVAVFGADTQKLTEIKRYTKTFLKTKALDNIRYKRRIEKMSKLGQK